MTFQFRILTQICIFPPCLSDYPWSSLYEQEVIHFYRRANWLTGKRFVRKTTWKGNMLSKNCYKYNFLSLCPNNDIEKSIFVWRRVGSIPAIHSQRLYYFNDVVF